MQLLILHRLPNHAVVVVNRVGVAIDRQSIIIMCRQYIAALTRPHLVKCWRGNFQFRANIIHQTFTALSLAAKSIQIIAPVLRILVWDSFV
ncbi:hypothetical protein D3C75_1070630 [compost metagenome]